MFFENLRHKSNREKIYLSRKVPSYFMDRKNYGLGPKIDGHDITL